MDDPDPGARSGGEPGLGGLFGEPGAAPRSRDVLARVVDALLEASPEAATALGDHRFDDLLDDLSTEGMAARADVLRDALQALDGVDDVGLAPGDRVDLDVLRGAVVADVWRLDELRAHEHDPRVHLPGRALRPLLAPRGGHVPEPAARAQSLTARLCGVPRRLAVARAQLRELARVHVEAALEEARADAVLLGAPVDTVAAAVAERAPGAAQALDAARAGAAAALAEHAAWLESRLADSEADPRLGAQRYAATLWYALDTETAPDVLLTRAESDLQGVEEELADAAAVVGGSSRRGVRQVLADHPGATGSWAAAVAEAARRVRESRAVSVPPGVELPPRPAPGRSARGPQLLVAAHEAVPGLALQAAHARATLPVRAVRRVVASEVFVQGWAAYAEDLVAGAGDDEPVLRVHLLHRRLLATIDAVLDVRVHAEQLPRAEALRLLTDRGSPRRGGGRRLVARRAARAGPASAPYSGYHDVRDVVGRLCGARPAASAAALHDAVLAYGAPAPRHLSVLLGLPDLPEPPGSS